MVYVYSSFLNEDAFRLFCFPFRLRFILSCFLASVVKVQILCERKEKKNEEKNGEKKNGKEVDLMYSLFIVQHLQI